MTNIIEERSLADFYASFAKIVEKYGFIKSTEINEGQFYSVEYTCPSFAVKLQKYGREFYAILDQPRGIDNGVDLFNLLGYLNRWSPNAPISNYFREEKDINESNKKQFQYIANTLYENFAAIECFFKGKDYKSKEKEIREYLDKMYPNLFGP